MAEETDLGKRLRALAQQRYPDVAAEMRKHADELDAATAGYMHAEPPTVTVRGFMGAWARARKLWCRESGEPLV